MSVISIACIVLGALNGAFLAAMPKMDDPNPSIFKLAALGTVLAVVLVFLAAATTTPEFWTTALSTIGIAVAAFFTFGGAFGPSEKSQPAERRSYISRATDNHASNKAA